MNTYKPHSVIVQMVHGSHLYGTNTPESDKDYKGVFLPRFSDILLRTHPDSITQSTKKRDVAGEKNGKDDVDTQLYSLHKFIDLASKGETVAIDMLHAPMKYLEKTSWEWNYIVNNKDRFYTKNMKSLLGYAARQAHKYGVKGSRLAAVKDVVRCMEEAMATLTCAPEPFIIGEVRMKHITEFLPTNEYCYFTETDGANGEKETVYVVAGKMLQMTASVTHYLPMLDAFINEYGGRARMAEQNQGVDWKALSHAYRACYQALHIYRDGGFEYPMPETDILLEIKTGKMPFDKVASGLEELIVYVKELADQSSYPDHVDMHFWQNRMMEIYARNFNDWWY